MESITSTLGLLSTASERPDGLVRYSNVLEPFALPTPDPDLPPLPWSPRFSSFPEWDTLERLRLSTSYPPFSEPIFKFHPDEESAEHNWALLKNNSFDLDSLVCADENSQLFPGSEFRHPDELDLLFGGYIDWWFIRGYMTGGAGSYSQPLPEHLRMEALQAGLAYGNHTPDNAALMQLLLPEIAKGFFLPIPKGFLHEIPGIVVAPMNIDWHFSIDDEGNRVHKPRLIHDMTYTPHLPVTLGDWHTSPEINQDLALPLRQQILEVGHPVSLNARNIESILPPCRYGHALSRFVTAVSELRYRYPDEQIFISKTDWKAAYRRIHARHSAAFQTVVVIGELAYICLRFTFGQASAPPLFSAASDMLAAFITCLISQPFWGPEGRLGSYDHHIDWSMKASSDGPLQPARPMIVRPTLEGDFANDIYIDDNIAAVLGSNAKKVIRAMMYALEVLDRPCHHPSPLKRDPLLSLSKLGVEGSPNEVQEVLGWLVDTRRMTIGLSPGKYLNWMTDLDECLEDREGMTTNQLHSMIGRFECLSTVFRPGRHFLGNLRFALQRAVEKKWRRVHLTAPQRLDAKLFRDFLFRCREGISLNLVVPRLPDRVTRVDACMYGMGGYSLSSGIAWQFLLPPPLQFRIHINLLEFLAEFISILMDYHYSQEDWPPHCCILTLGDNTNAIRWMARTKFEDGTRAGHNVLARTFAQWWLDHDCIGYGQWLPGHSNNIADTLSRHFQYHPSHLSQTLRELYPHETTPNFKITPVPADVLQVVSDMLRSLPLNPPEQDPKERRPPWLGADGKISFLSLDTKDLVSSLTAAPPTNVPTSSAISQPDFANASSPDKAVIDWAKEVSQPPVELWQRRF